LTVATKVGRYIVLDESLTVVDDTELSLAEWQAVELRAAYAVFAAGIDISAAELEFARKSLGFTRSEFPSGQRSVCDCLLHAVTHNRLPVAIISEPNKADLRIK
jgi:hypothetical protein